MVGGKIFSTIGPFDLFALQAFTRHTDNTQLF